MARKRKPEEHENLERWLVSYADFITLLFAFFVVMYAISQINEGKYKVLSDSLLQAFQNPSTAPPLPVQRVIVTDPKSNPTPPKADAIMPRKSDAQAVLLKKETEKMKGIAKDIMKALERLVKAGKVRVTQSSRGIAVEINASVLFASGQASLEGESLKILKAVAEVLVDVDNHLQVEGYSDNAPIQSVMFPSNWELSSARASGVARLFVENGIQPVRVMVVGYGENKPVDTNDTPEGRARNRRVIVMILSSGQEKVIADLSTGAETAPATPTSTPTPAPAPLAIAPAAPVGK
ncbi:MAG: flagellar motor protein MotD [Sulfuricellaceae bacterium]